MADFRLDPETRDLAREGQLTLAEDGGLGTAVILSLFLDARANADDPLPDPNSEDRGGWWGNALASLSRWFSRSTTGSGASSSYEIGSRLWTFRRSKNTAQTRTEMRDACVEALEWLRDDGIAREVNVDVVTHDSDPNAVQINVLVVEETGREQAFAFVWDLIRGRLQ